MATWKGGPKPPPRVVAPNKLWHAFKHKNLDVFKIDLDADEDQNYVAASERFLEFQAQLGMVLHHTETFRKSLEESLQQALELADDFGRVAAGNGGGRTVEPWAHKAGGQAFFLKGMLEESVVSLRQHLHDDLEEKAVRSLREEVASFSTVHAQMLDRSNLKIDMLHYSNKVQDLKGSQKATDEKKDRNKEKYAQASQALRDQTNQLMSIFAHAEQVRQKLLTQDLPSVISAEKNAFDSFAINLNKAAAETSDGEPRPPRMSDAARIPHRDMPSSDFPASPTSNALAEVSLEDSLPRADGIPPAYSSPFPVKVEPPAAGEVTQTIVKKRSPMPMSPKDSGAPWSGSNDGGEFGEELKRAHEHQNSKMAAEMAAAAGAAAAAVAGGGGGGRGGGGGGGGGGAGGEEPAVDTATTNSATSADDTESRDPSEVTAAATAAAAAAAAEDAPPPISPEPSAVDNGGSTERGESEENPSAPPPGAAETAQEGPEVIEAVAGGPEDVSGAAAAAVAAEEEEEEMAELEPGKVRVRALYDYDATQDGDLSFVAGDMIVTDGGAFSGDGWVSGTCHGDTGIFPANYTEPW
ncbi:unnamed protein product [Pylaiella littoralis]